MSKNPLGDDLYDFDPDDPFGGLRQRRPGSPAPAPRPEAEAQPYFEPPAPPQPATASPEPIPSAPPKPVPPPPPPEDKPKPAPDPLVARAKPTPAPSPAPKPAAAPTPKPNGSARRARLEEMGEALARAQHAKLTLPPEPVAAPRAWKAAPVRKTAPPAENTAAKPDERACQARGAGWIDSDQTPQPVVVTHDGGANASPLSPEEIAAVLSGLAVVLARARRVREARPLVVIESEPKRRDFRKMRLRRTRTSTGTGRQAKRRARA
ncbi:MAG: hypothetical protein ACE37J_11910 [Pikeienuella sp.]|uniref:hypothetical protein n=1 Tax=Pikeienuella sp. TaxID=2831957 RepID=UPI00391C4FD5